MKNFKLFSALVVLMLTMGFTSCSSDDDNGPDVSGKKDYLVTFDVKADGATSSEILDWEDDVEYLIYELMGVYTNNKNYRIDGVSFEEAKDIFNDFIEEFEYEFNRNYHVTAKYDLEIYFYLKTDKEGAVVSQKRIVFEAE